MTDAFPGIVAWVLDADSDLAAFWERAGEMERQDLALCAELWSNLIGLAETVEMLRIMFVEEKQ